MTIFSSSVMYSGLPLPLPLRSQQVKLKSDPIPQADRTKKSDKQLDHGQQQTESAFPSSRSRRAFIGTVAAGVVALPPLLSSQIGEAHAQEFEVESAATGKKRAKQAF